MKNIAIAPVLILLGLCGCGPATAVVSGEVRVDGAPLKKGLIVLSAGGTANQAEILDGRYQISTIAGAKAVQISEDLGTIKKKEHNGPDAPWMDVPKGEGLPPQYNSASTLTLDVPAGSSTKDWDLSRNPK